MFVTLSPTVSAPEAIAEYQANKIQKLTTAAPDEQTTAQAELATQVALN